MMAPIDEPDEMVGAALRRLPVPEHRPGFRVDVQGLLERELEERRRAGRLNPDTGGGRRRGASPDHVMPARPPRTLRWGLAAAAFLVAVAILVTAGLPGRGPDVATAAEVRARVAEAWASARSIRGELVAEDPAYGSGERRWSFLLTARGDFRLEDLTRGGVVTYDAAEGIERALSVSESMPNEDRLFASERAGLPPGPPDLGPSDTTLDRSLGSVVRALLAANGGSVREIQHEGRPTWVLETDIRPNLIVPESSPDHLRVLVDQETGFPVQVVATHDGTFVRETRIEGLEVNVPVPAQAFELEFPPDAEVFRSDAGFRRVGPGQVEAIVGYEPATPSWLPDGYEPAEVAVSTQPSPTGTEGGNPPVGDVISLVYRRGLDRFLVTWRPVGTDPSSWDDPLATGEGFVDDPERVTFGEGALAGTSGALLIDPLAIPHVWAVADGFVVTVSGDLTRAELLRAAESLS